MKSEKAMQECEHGKMLIEPCEPCGREPVDIDGDELVRMRRSKSAVASLSAQTAPDFDAIAIELARELYDRFVMGGWSPEDSYSEIVRRLQIWHESSVSGAAQEEAPRLSRNLRSSPDTSTELLAMLKELVAVSSEANIPLVNSKAVRKMGKFLDTWKRAGDLIARIEAMQFVESPLARNLLAPTEEDN